MATDSAKEFLASIRQSGLMTREQVQERLDKIEADSGPEPGARDMAKQLVKSGQLTKYQAARLLDGRTKGFFIKHYRILDRIGMGGMGKVYKARDEQLDRPVALKVLRRQLSDHPKLVARFKREAMASARLDHPNIVRTYDVGTWHDLHYIVFEFVSGVDLKTILTERGKLTLEHSVAIVKQAAIALEHASAQGVVHRDLKPSNILITSQGQVKLLDMGLARIEARDHDGDENLRITLTHEIVGTFDYMSPEQAMNTSQVDTRSDLYALGCTWYHMLTGQPPFPEGSGLEKLEKHQNTAPTPPSSLRPSLDPQVDHIVLRLLAKTPDERYQTPGELLQALGTLGARQPARPMVQPVSQGGAEANPTLTIDAPWQGHSSITYRPPNMSGPYPQQPYGYGQPDGSSIMPAPQQPPQHFDWHSSIIHRPGPTNNPQAPPQQMHPQVAYPHQQMPPHQMPPQVNPYAQMPAPQDSITDSITMRAQHHPQSQDGDWMQRRRDWMFGLAVGVGAAFVAMVVCVLLVLLIIKN